MLRHLVVPELKRLHPAAEEIRLFCHGGKNNNGQNISPSSSTPLPLQHTSHICHEISLRLTTHAHLCAQTSCYLILQIVTHFHVFLFSNKKVLPGVEEKLQGSQYDVSSAPPDMIKDGKKAKASAGP